MQMLRKKRVAEFETWWRVFRSHGDAHIDAPESAEAGRVSGVVEGAYHFVVPGEGYGE